MSSTRYMASLLAPFEPQVPTEVLVESLNRFYHAREADLYDARHPEIHEELTSVWKHMVEVGLPGRPDHDLRVLDFGCGTGFEAAMLLGADLEGRVGEMVCYDLSPEMIDVCRDTLWKTRVPIEFVTDGEALMEQSRPFDVLITNSLLHHLPDPLATIRSLMPLLTDDAVWLAGHEPSSRFFKNGQCWKTLQECERMRKFRKYVTPDKYREALRRILNPDADPAEGTARAALNEGLVKKKLSRDIIHRAVDCQVPHSPEEAHCGRGLDFVQMEHDLAGQWKLVWKRTYNFMGPYLERDLPNKWRLAARRLHECFPDDGASFCAIWQRGETQDAP
ncbi:MAG: class I SAM-dependent methyltransferase [Pirellulales bacterium]|nr:class I SAM-dependent methyltransferase [Pirellulales bacterium]